MVEEGAGERTGGASRPRHARYGAGGRGAPQGQGPHRPRLLSDKGSSYISGDLAKWLKRHDMGHVRGAPYLCVPRTPSLLLTSPNRLTSAAMIALLCFFLTPFASPFKSKSRLEAENAALRHQPIVLQRRVRRNRSRRLRRAARPHPHAGDCHSRCGITTAAASQGRRQLPAALGPHGVSAFFSPSLSGIDPVSRSSERARCG